MTRRLGWSCLVAVTLLMLPLLAQVGPGVQEEEQGQVSRWIEYGEVTITGTLTGPSSSYLLAKPEARFVPLIPVRANMLPEVVRSVDNL